MNNTRPSLGANQAYGLAAPNVQELERRQQTIQAMMPTIKKIISGERVEGIDPNMAMRLMGIVGPAELKNLHTRGMDVDPNWYQNYIQPGVVDPKTYNTIMDYSRAFGFEDTPVALQGGFSQWGENPAYVLTNALPDYRQTMLNDAYNNMRMAMQGMVYDPISNNWIYDTRLGDQMVADYLQRLDQEGDVAGALGVTPETTSPWYRRFVSGLVDSALNVLSSPGGLGSDTTLPIVGTPEVDAAVSALTGQPVHQTVRSIPPSVSAKHQREAEQFGVDPKQYEVFKNSMINLARESRNNPSLVMEIWKVIADLGLDIPTLDAIGADWWVNHVRPAIDGQYR